MICPCVIPVSAPKYHLPNVFADGAPRVRKKSITIITHEEDLKKKEMFCEKKNTKNGLKIHVNYDDQNNLLIKKVSNKGYHTLVIHVSRQEALK